MKDDVGVPRIGLPPENRRQRMVKLCWVCVWMIYLAYPVSDLLDGSHTVPVRIVGWVALAAFLGSYIALVFRRQVGGAPRPGRPFHLALLLGMLTVSVVTSYLLSSAWLTLFVYTAIATGVLLAPRYSLAGVTAVTACLVVVGLTCPDRTMGNLGSAAVSAFLGGAAMGGLQGMVRTMQELREARQAVAALAASDERLRMARDLHDLLGHSLSLITLKSELTSRFLDQGRYAEAQAQVADIEKVSRQSLVDVREAIGGYRRPKIAVELAALRIALEAADVAVDADQSIADAHPGLGPEEEGALGWALREAATNIVRHSAAKNCTVRLAEYLVEDGSRALRLDVVDDGMGVGKRSGHSRGNGLSGLAERLALADGTLETGPGPRGRGFSLRASVPLRAQSKAPADSGLAGTVHP
jgi:two-component system sensor histidine kinase DesK